MARIFDVIEYANEMNDEIVHRFPVRLRPGFPGEGHLRPLKERLPQGEPFAALDRNPQGASPGRGGPQFVPPPLLLDPPQVVQAPPPQGQQPPPQFPQHRPFVSCQGPHLQGVRVREGQPLLPF